MLTEMESKRLKKDLYDWHFIQNNHTRGCYLEALAGEFERGRITKDFLIEVLRGIATLMK